MVKSWLSVKKITLWKLKFWQRLGFKSKSYDNITIDATAITHLILADTKSTRW